MDVFWNSVATNPPSVGQEVLGLTITNWKGTPKVEFGPATMFWDGKRWWASWDDRKVIESESWAGTTYKEPDLDPTHWCVLPRPSFES